MLAPEFPERVLCLLSGRMQTAITVASLLCLGYILGLLAIDLSFDLSDKETPTQLHEG